MYLFTRRVVTKPGRGPDHAVHLTKLVPELANASGLPVSLLTPFGSSQVGTFVMAMAVPDLPTLVAASQKVVASPALTAGLRGTAGNLVGPPEDVTWRFLSEPSPDPALTMFTTAIGTARLGSITKAIGDGMPVAELVKKHGFAASLIMAMNGATGTLGYIFGYKDAAEWQRFGDEMMASDEFWSHMVKLDPHTIPGSNVTENWRRLALAEPS